MVALKQCGTLQCQKVNSFVNIERQRQMLHTAIVLMLQNNIKSGMIVAQFIESAGARDRPSGGERLGQSFAFTAHGIRLLRSVKENITYFLWTGIKNY